MTRSVEAAEYAEREACKLPTADFQLQTADCGLQTANAHACYAPAVFSERLPWDAETNALSEEVARFRGESRPFIDLTVSNPTLAGLDYPTEELADALREAAAAKYDPNPSGILSAREALAEFLSSPGDEVSADDLVLTASTSEAYGYLLKLFCDPGDEVITPKPGYPLLEHLAALESVSLRFSAIEPLRGEKRTRWRHDLDSLAAACGDRTRFVSVVHPNNPTGNYVAEDEQRGIAAICSERSLPLVSDEVFYAFALGDEPLPPAMAALPVPLTFSLGGLSKSAGLPHWKLGWIRIGGDVARREEARRALELIADTYLSAATPVQVALPRILALAPLIRGRISERCRTNLAAVLRSMNHSSVDVLAPQGGWTVVLRLPRLCSDEELALRLLRENGVLVQPGYFYDFSNDGFVVLSLLCEPGEFGRGVEKLAAFLETHIGR